MAKAVLLFDTKTSLDGDHIVHLRMWRVPTPVPPSTHGLKYSLFFGRPGERLVGYDNERGKGDHKHVRGVETRYTFINAKRLLADFRADVEKVLGKKLPRRAIAVKTNEEAVLHIDVGRGFDEIAEEFVDVWERAERGEEVTPRRSVSFESFDRLTRVFTDRRLELLRAVSRRPNTSVATLARHLKRDYKNVYEDVRALADAGLIERDDGGIHLIYDTIDARITLND